jgi:serine/threonine-protein kinase
MGKVYRAEQTPLGRVCALKVLNPNYAGDGDPEFQKRFFLEASIASRLKHPNTVTVFDYGKSEDDVFYMAMELLEGKTLHKAIRESGSLPEERAMHVARQICRSLREAHQMGVIHRDLKPANIFLTEHGDEPDFVKVLDFGLVKNIEEKPEDQLTHTGLFMGSPKYMAPEQIQGASVDGRTDVYALGVILYEMLTGKVPFDRATSVNTLMAHVSEAPPAMRMVKPDVQVSPALEDLIYRCIAKDPATRPSSMEDVLIALKHASGIPHLQATGDYGSFQAIKAAAKVSATGSNPVPTFGSYGPNISNSYPPPAVYPSAPPPAYASRPPPGPGASQSATPMPIVGAELSAQLAGVELEQRRSPFLIPIIALAAVVLGGSFGFGVYRASQSRQQAQQALGTAPPTETPVLPSATPSVTPPVAVPASSSAVVTPAPPGVVKWVITTDPEGAAVRDNGIEICNATPCEVSMTDAESKKPHHFTFFRAGYKPDARIAKIADGPVFVHLVRATGGGARPPKDPGGATSAAPGSPGPASTSASGATTATPNGFKETPY